jgi:hypothetical protein
MATLDNGDDVTQLSGRAALRMHVRIHNHQPRVGESLKSKTLSIFLYQVTINGTFQNVCLVRQRPPSRISAAWFRI